MLFKGHLGIIPLLISVILFSIIPSAFADHATASVSIPDGTSVPGCEETNECFIPYSVTIDSGGEVTWSNDDTAAHTVTSGTPTDGPDGNFDSSTFMAGTTFSVKFDDYEPGAYPYFCMFHPWMVGEVIVESAGAEPIPEPKSSINVLTDKSSYDQGEIIKVSGEVTNPRSNVEVGLMVISPAPSDNIAVVDQVKVDPFGNFELQLGTTGATWAIGGTYTIKVTYGSQQVYDSVTINLRVSDTPTSIPSTSVPSGADVIIPSGTSVPGCENTNSCFSPSKIRVGPTSTVTWYNADSAAHTVTSGTPDGGPDGEFDSSLFMSETTFAHKFDRAGTYPYLCMVHPWMTGYVIVERGGSVSTPSSPIPTPTPPSLPKPSPSPSTVGVSVAQGSSVPGCEETNECFIPYEIRVAVGGEVTWNNDDSAAHTVTSGTAKDGPDGNFDSSLFMAGTTFSVKFDDSGTYPYFCMVHPWMLGVVVVGQGGTSPPPPTPRPDISISVDTDSYLYDLGDIVNLSVKLSGTSKSQNVGISVTDPTGHAVISRTLTTDSSGRANTEFGIHEDFKTGTYTTTATVSVGGVTYKDTSSFKIESQFNQIKIISVQGTDQQGNPSSFSRGELGFVKVIVSANKPIATLVTVNLFDSELTTIGIASFRTTLSPGESEMILSFLIPDDAAIGSADIYANAFSDWPSNGGIPLTGEFSAQVRIT